MRRQDAVSTDPSSLHSQRDRTAEERKAAAERDGKLKRRRDVALEQVKGVAQP